MFSKSSKPPTIVIPEDKMDEVIDHILQGKYSGACLMLLEATGHNPLQYMPYRTYNRLQKQRLQATREKADVNKTASIKTMSVKVVDLDYVDSLEEQISTAKQGGMKRKEIADIINSLPLWTRQLQKHSQETNAEGLSLFSVAS